MILWHRRENAHLLVNSSIWGLTSTQRMPPFAAIVISCQSKLMYSIKNSKWRIRSESARVVVVILSIELLNLYMGRKVGG